MDKDMIVPISVWNRLATENQELRKAVEDLMRLNTKLQQDRLLSVPKGN